MSICSLDSLVLIISLKTVFEILNLVKSYDKTSLNVIVCSLRDKYRWGLTSFGQYTCTVLDLLYSVSDG